MDARKITFGAIALLLAGTAQVSQAQSTDGFHAIQVFPIVVDSASFTQRFHFRVNQFYDGTPISVIFYPAQGTAQATPLTCPSFFMPTLGERSFASLRALCPGLPVGTAFGTLVASSSFGQTFSAYSRASNPAGNGFSVESFPANTFTDAVATVTGLRRLSAQGAAPAFQTNCFIGNLAELGPAAVTFATEVNLSLNDSSGVLLGQTVVAVQPGQLVRLLDVFATAGLATGDYEDVVAKFESFGSGVGLITFCTVQDNTSFGADFRIGKQESAHGIVPGAQDEGAMRLTFSETEEAIDSQDFGADLAIPAGASRNVHQFYFRHPDVISCELQIPGNNHYLVTPAYGLEMRLRVHDPDMWRVLAGGNDSVAFSSLYLGAKQRHGNGANTTYQLEVESNGQNSGANRPYVIVCASGSGHSKGELLRKGLDLTF